MVGVPRRSKCRTCAKRHIACDLQHLKQDACGQCIKSRRVCEVPQNHIFVNHDEGTHKTVYRKADGERDHSDGCRPSAWPLLLRPDHFAGACGSSKESRTDSFSSTILPQSIPAVALVKQQFIANARTSVLNESKNDSGFPPFWSSAITSQTDSWACRTSPALACYTSWLGRNTDDTFLIEASRKLYVQGLKEVQQAVNDPNTALMDETLSACISLIIYEALECPDHSYSAYHKHIDGCSALIKLRGASAHRDGVGHDLFRGFRYIAVIKALQDHRGSYLVTPEWSQIPFSLHPKDIHDKLLDILATGASFLSESDRFGTIPPSQILIPLLDMGDRILELDSSLEALYAELASMHDGPLFWSTGRPLSPLDEASDGDSEQTGFRTPICFQDQETARLLTLYWAQRTLLRMGWDEIRLGLAGMAAAGMVQGHAERVNRSLSQPAKPLIESAHLVLRARDYCSSSQSMLLRYSVPLNITLDVLANKPEQYGEEIKFAKDIKRQIGQRHLRITQYTSTLKHVNEV